MPWLSQDASPTSGLRSESILDLYVNLIMHRDSTFARTVILRPSSAWWIAARVFEERYGTSPQFDIPLTNDNRKATSVISHTDPQRRLWQKLLSSFSLGF
jgi:hypothetical protein